ncbi:tripartite-type tricarboxylate transporter receptor subunit TctC [Natronocella acetinitrilica]|uniref:Tripartite-type tricarboxylate transporter receptor subunit TctC n=1 Tax=Natronocella acetinitrilica TaxID=414046 RepID=A0AAE3KDK5_9GAMM|nr:tripartite tricarboxylate transporter substrate binding protein [Natronocella acetinitrilica]MCP1676954.1 tripartite-type tricarboxylate transporter receptor subunit TctC [Natronocella acetinitrilica]
MKTRKSLTRIMSGALALSAAAIMFAGTTATASDWPDRPFTVMIPYTAGGASDFQARIATIPSEEYLGFPTAIINRPGAGGQVGWNQVVQQADTSGSQLAGYNVPHFIAQSIMHDTYYNIGNLEPIANWGVDPAVLVVHRDSEFDSVDDLVAYAKENPGRVTFSGAGQFVGHHIATMQLEAAAGIELRYVPTSGGVDAMRFVQGQQVMAGFNNLSDAYRGRDRLKILAIADLERDEDFLPDVPTLMELGYEVDDSSVNFRGIMAPAGVSEERLEWLSEKVVEMFNDERVANQMKAGGSPMRVMNRQEVREMWERREVFLKELFEGMDP